MKLLIKMMVTAWTKTVRNRRSRFIDAIDLFQHRYKPVISINNEGKLYFHSTAFNGEITGLMEWETKHKEYMNVKRSCTVIDCIVELEKTTE